MSQFAKPTGFYGRILAKGMAWGHRDFYDKRRFTHVGKGCGRRTDKESKGDII